MQLNIRWQDIVDIVIIASAIYFILVWTQTHRARLLIQGILVILLVYLFSYYFQFYTINWLMKKITTVLLLIFIIVFQPELRIVLEKIGRMMQLKKFWQTAPKQNEGFFSVHVIQNLLKIVDSFSENRVGSIIVIEQENNLDNIKDTGVYINAEFSPELLGSMFYGRNPLHDGAVLLKGNKIMAASCLLPLTTSKLRDRSLGTRHRAALGLAEHTDAIVIVTSEETGYISLAKNGTLYRKLNRKKLQEHLLSYLQLACDDKENCDKVSAEKLFANVDNMFKNIFEEKHGNEHS